MANITKFNENLNIISSLPDKPTKSADELKADFDKGVNLIKNYINNILIPQLESGIYPVINNLSTGGTTSSLSAEMGKKLNTEKQAKIGYGTEVPTLAEGEIFIQIFD